MAFAAATYFFLASIFMSQGLSQSNRQFQWSFRDKGLSDLPTCSPLSIVVESFDTKTDLTTGIPPYYMISYPIGGMPITSLLGSDIDNLTWTAMHPLDSEVILNVVDSTGGSGGVSANPRRVVAGVTTGCIVNADNVETFVIGANVSGSLSQGETWGITVSGGFPPYVVMLAETNSSVVTNSTPLAIGAIVFPQRVNLGSTLVVAISDAQGQWASGTPVVHLEGSRDEISHQPMITSLGAPITVQLEIAFQSPRTDVVATPTTSSGVTSKTTSSASTNADPNNGKSMAQRQLKAIALGLSIPLAGILGVAGVLGFCNHRKRRGQFINEQPAPFFITSGVRERHEGNDSCNFQQRALNTHRDASMNERTGGEETRVFPSIIRHIVDQSSSQVTLSRDLATRPLQPLSSATYLRQDYMTDHSYDIEGPPDYCSRVSE